MISIFGSISQVETECNYYAWGHIFVLAVSCQLKLHPHVCQFERIFHRKLTINNTSLYPVQHQLQNIAVTSIYHD